MLYFAVMEPVVKVRLIKCVSQWNKDHAPKYGSIEIVSELEQSDVAAVFFWGTADSIVLLPIIMDWGHEWYQATWHLVTKDTEGVRVLWLKPALETSKKN